MVENKAEKFYWYLLIVTLLSSPLLVQLLYTQNFNLRFSTLYLIVLFLIGNLFQLPLELILNGKGIAAKFWVKNPSVSIRYSVEGKPDDWMLVQAEKIKVLGFQLVPAPTEKLAWHIRKPKVGQAYGFLDHGFEGRIVIEQSSFGNEAVIELTLLDILIVDTGERDQLLRLAEYLVGKAASPILPTFHLIVACAAFLAIVSHVLLYLKAFDIWKGAIPVYEACYGALGMAVWMLIVMLSRKYEFIGFRVLYGSILVALIPLLVILSKFFA